MQRSNGKMSGLVHLKSQFIQGSDKAAQTTLFSQQSSDRRMESPRVALLYKES